MSSDLAERRQSIIDQYGPWTAHNIELDEGIYTISPRKKFDCSELVAVIEDFVAQPFHELRILDLACLEGLYALEFAKLGAEVVGIEGREQNVAKARFAQEVLGLGNVTFHQDDVRNLSASTYGTFDVVFCCGILYHLDIPDAFHFVRRIQEVTRQAAIFNTHVSPADLSVPPWDKADPKTRHPALAALRQSFNKLLNRVPEWERIQEVEFEGHTYRFRRVPEHPETSSQEQRLEATWASLDNPYSVWFTKESLHELLMNMGFENVYHCLSFWNTHDRLTMVGTGSDRRSRTPRGESAQGNARQPTALHSRDSGSSS